MSMKMQQADANSNDPAKQAALDGTRRSYGILPRVAFASAAMFALFVGCGGWAATAELAGAVISQGLVVVDGHVKKVQHRDGGIVTQINVRNGDRVKAGDVLVRLDETQVRAELGVIQSQLLELRARQARLVAERQQALTITFPSDLMWKPDAAGVMEGETRLFEDGRKTREGQKEQLAERIEQLRHEASGLSAQGKSKELELSLIRKELTKARELLAKELAPATRVYALEREEARIAGEHGSLVAQEARANGQITETRLQILMLDQSAKTEAQRELRTVESRLAELREREIASQDRLVRMEIRAPQNGIVHQLEVHTVGGVVSPAEPLMLVVPDSEKLAIELRISPSEIDQVRVQQDVRLKFTSFNQRTTPELKGHIAYVSADITQDPRSKQEYYSARAVLDGIRAYEIGGKPILPGMPVEAFITTEQRTALSYLTKPMMDQFARSFRER